MSSPHVPSPDPAKAVRGKKKGSAAPKQRGPKGHFKGTKKSYLESHFQAYLDTKKGSRVNFWHAVYTGWWARYPWKLEDEFEPPAEEAKLTRLRTVAPGEEDLKKEVELKLTERLTQWFANRAAALNGSRREILAWLPLLQQLHQIRNPAPRKRNAVQQFMLEYPDAVNAAFIHRYGDAEDSTNVEKMNLRRDVAKALLVSKYSSIRSGLNERAADQHSVETDEWRLVLKHITSARDVSFARDTLFDALHPLLQAVGTYADCYVSFIAGNPKMSETDKGFFTAVHWWPGDQVSEKDWTQWDPEGFDSGVAGPFLTYAKENHEARKGDPVSVVPVPQTSPHLTLPNTTSANETQPVDTLPPIHVQRPTAATTAPGPQTKYRSRPAQRKSSTPTSGTNKRKHRSKSHHTRFFQDPSSESDENANRSGDGSSSGDSAPSDAPGHPKRLRTSKVTTRSSTQTSAPNLGVQGTLNSPSLPIPGASSIDTVAITTPTDLSDLQPSNSSADKDADDSPSEDAPPAYGKISSIPPTKAKHVSPSETGVVPAPTKVASVAGPEDTSVTEPELVGESGSIAGAPSITTTAIPPLALSIIINAGDIPAFLTSHGKGNRRVDIFKYLNEVEDPRFQQVLLHYINFEVNDKSAASGALPTINRPIEISQWSSRARPAILLDFAKGKRTFQMFVDSVFAWWGSLQPPWRSFERGTISRGVQGDWGVLCAPRINGLLNIVILVYWWARVLEEQQPEGGVRADYEFFADDVAWVISRLAT